MSSAPAAKVTSTAPPVTEDIDSEWPEEPEASVASSVGSLAPATDEVDSGWLSDGEPAEKPRAALAQPNFPADRALPNELWGAAGAESRRSGKDSSPPGSSPPVSSAPVAEKRSEEPASAAPIATAPAVTTDVAVAAADSARKVAADEREPVRLPVTASSRGKLAVAALAAAALAGLWFARGGSHSPEEPGVQALRPEPAHVEPAKIEPAIAEPAAVEPAASASAEVPAPAASAEATPGKVVVIVNVRPPHARIYYHGKEAGKAPLRVELDPGKKRSFEVGSPGFMTRKIVIDGSKPEVLVGLRAASPYASGPAPEAPQN